MKKETFDSMGFYLNNETPKEVLMIEVQRLSNLCLRLKDHHQIESTIDLLITINQDLRDLLK